MREIKFRAWHNTRKEMFFITELTFLFESITGIAAKGYSKTKADYDIMPEDLTLMQYTGLKDKEGTEIYEGDIVQYLGVIEVYNRESEVFYNTDKYTLGWAVEFKMSERENSSHWSPNIYAILNELEIIGNKFENPELLK